MAKWKGRPHPVLEIWGERNTCVLLLGTSSSYGTRETPGQLYVGLHEAKSACAQGSEFTPLCPFREMVTPVPGNMYKEVY